MYSTYQIQTLSAFFNALLTFLQASDWTVKSSNVSNTGIQDAYSIVFYKQGLYFEIFHEDGTNPDIRLAAYPTSDTSDPGHNITCTERLGEPFENCWFYSYAEVPALYMVLEILPGEYRHLAVGELDKAFDYVGGQYITLTHWESDGGESRNRNSVMFSDDVYKDYYGENDKVRADLDGNSEKYFLFNRDSGVARGEVGVDRDGLASMLQIGGNTYNKVAPMYPLYVRAPRTGGGYTFLGSPYGIRALNIKKIAPETVLDDGSDTWKVFPAIRKGKDGVRFSEDYGYAYLVED